MEGPETHGPVMLLRLAGRVDGKAAQELQQRCAEIRNQGFVLVALDLSAVTFLASSGLGVFLAETEAFKEVGGSLHLVAVSAVVASVIKLLNVDRFLSMVPSVDALLASISA
jgi:anti-sigma B factor antagonist